MKNQKGLSLIEVVIALAAGVIVIAAITGTVITSLSNTESSANQNTATKYVQAGIDTVRQMRNAGTLSPLVGTSAYCMDKSCSALSSSGTTCGPKAASCSQNIDNTYSREVDINFDTCSCPNQYQVRVVVAWADSKCFGSGVASAGPGGSQGGCGKDPIYPPASANLCHQVEAIQCITKENTVPLP
ncbi:MAG TPA: prepilin-type N-terminal cleavage/methylation domain-containing protein [Candidatus Saccharimonadales bacterium]|nr:prepilin-type N-terminal cleavage/methylation domain-containing protein [Candidatus Saccharimonadales bacterium]